MHSIALGYARGRLHIVIPQLKVGDRVRARTSTPVPAGTLGRVSMALISVVDMYFVQFDGEVRQR